ncbi:MAG TPA: hypothetical protein VHM65_00055 [Candidatus Lustribacter sp.]|nr:hypothetical protein [Candidatus Lustribacter sp.]
MLAWLTTVVLLATVALAVVATIRLVRNDLIDDGVLLVAAVLEVGLIAQLVVCATRMSQVSSAAERATFLAYAASLPFIPAGTAFLAIKEKSRWAMGVILVGAFAIGVMTGRLQQIWNLNA